MTGEPSDAFDLLVAAMHERPELFDQLAPGVADLLQDLKEGPPDVTAILKIMEVKLQKRAPRALKLINAVPAEITEQVVRHALALKHEEAATQVEAVRISLLCALPGIEVPVASALLAWSKPSSYGVLDRRAWKTLHRFKLVKSRSKKNTTYTANDWARYLFLLRALAEETKRTPQRVDTWLYAYDKAKPT
ncbi:MAG: hypothetical protein ABL883_11155 [Terricaulis sp.]